MIHKLRIQVQMVGLHAVNPAKDPRGYIKLATEAPLRFDRNPIYFNHDDYAASGEWEGEHLGHIVTRFTAPITDLY